jgi:hypothetical protein
VGCRTGAIHALAIAAPLNAYLNYSGRLACERGFKKVAESCEAIQVPTHAHLKFSGDTRDCDPGYRQLGQTCTEDDD